ncbi:hypothetical protein [Metabacillus halosaccharovorans]|uniref:hypothetical protein n=1 Tax=Metabacillus halosaccharovorans TaxID=930124 RepID=UPI0009955B1D|nr:hypothetical protein [Metabacillus halosaccharovorans]
MLKYSKILLLIMMILPWFTIPLMDRRTFKRFLPASIFISLVVRLESYLAESRRWWWIYEKLHPRLRGETPVLWGPFIVGSLWILRFTYGKFYLYMLLNLIIDAFFSYPLLNFFQKLGFGSLVRLSRVKLLLIFMFKAVLLYGFQFVKEEYFVKKDEAEVSNNKSSEV